jgi:hypothetical protein
MKHTTKLKPISSSKLLQKAGRNVLSASFQSDISKLSYRQLIRISSIVDASNEAERKEAMRLIRSLTPVERSIVTKINRGRSAFSRLEMKKFMQAKLKEINAAETKKVDVQEILKSLLKDE